MMKSGISLLFGSALALVVLLYWLTQDDFIPKETFSVDEYSDDISKTNFAGKRNFICLCRTRPVSVLFHKGNWFVRETARIRLN